MDYQLLHTDGAARAGLITTDHGQIHTPIFMPVGTVGSVKGVHLRELKDDINAEIILGNTYHLYLRPGLDILERAGGLHKFNGFDRPMLTDSGGFQVFSLSGIRKLSEEGCEFRSHIDGSKHFFSPERVMDIERTIGADIMMAFDECPPGTADYSYARKSLDLTHGWMKRCWKRFNETEPKYGYKQALFPIVPPTDRAISWAWAPPSTYSKPLNAVWICLTASCQRATGATLACSPLRALLTCAMPNGLIALNLSTPWRIVLPMCNTPKPTCTTCSKPRNCWPCKLPLSTIWHSTCGWCARHANKLWQTTSDHGNATWLKSLDVNYKTPC